MEIVIVYVMLWIALFYCLYLLFGKRIKIIKLVNNSLILELQDEVSELKRDKYYLQCEVRSIKKEKEELMVSLKKSEREIETRKDELDKIVKAQNHYRN